MKPIEKTLQPRSVFCIHVLTESKAPRNARDHEVDDQRAAVHDGGDHRAGHNRRVKAQALGAHRQDTAHGGGEHDGKEFLDRRKYQR